MILTPDGYYSQKELVLPEASAHCFSLTMDEPLPPCRIPPPEGDPISFPRGWLTPARQPFQGFADLWQTLLTLASFHCSFPTPLQGGTQNRTYSQGWLWQGWRVLEARCSFCISQQYSFFNLLIFFLSQYKAPALCSACNPLHPPALFCRAAALPASPCIYLGFLPSALYLFS